MSKLVISHPETGERLGELRIPDGATTEDIIAAGEVARQQLLQKYVNAEHNAKIDAAPKAGSAERLILCQLCRVPQPESSFAAHCDEEEQAMLRREQAAQQQR